MNVYQPTSLFIYHLLAVGQLTYGMMLARATKKMRRGFCPTLTKLSNGQMEGCEDMAMLFRGTTDSELESFRAALDDYETHYPSAQATLYRQNPASIRLRIIDRRFEGMSNSRRHDDVWRYLESKIPPDSLSDISLLLTLAPTELKSTLMNFEFENPSPSGF